MVCYSEAQSLQIQAKLWALLPKDQLAEEVVYQGLAKGFRGKYTSVTFRNGSAILIKTTKQGPEALASGTVDHVQVDEPTSQACWQEIKGRVRRTAGTISATLTPINAPTEYLQEEVEAGVISDHQYPLTQANATPEGSARPLTLGDGTPIDTAYIERLRKETPASVRGIVLDGEWEVRGVGRYFDAFVGPGLAGSHVTAPHPYGEVPFDDEDGEIETVLGIDHGDRPGKQIAVLMAVQRLEGGAARVHVLDEYVDKTGTAAPEDDAYAILAMLSRHGLQWADLVAVMGDRVHLPGASRQKSNSDLQKYIARRLRVPYDAVRPRIYTSKRGEGRGKGSVGVGSRWLYYAMARAGGFSIHPRCERTIDAINTWTGPGPDCPEKDPIDAMRYGLDRYIFGRIRAGRAIDLQIG